jgi:hypothetical protein
MASKSEYALNTSLFKFSTWYCRHKSREMSPRCEVGHEILILGFRRDVNVICGLLGNYTASCGNCLPTFIQTPHPLILWPLSQRTVSYPATLPSFLLAAFIPSWISTREDGTDTLSRNVGK